MGDVSMVPVIWYYPRAATTPALMDQVPKPNLGNRLTVREYQSRWLDMLAFVTGEPALHRLTALPPELRFLAGLPPDTVTTPELEEIAFPVLGNAVVAPPLPCADLVCEPGAPAIIYGQKLQPIMAVADGVVTAVDHGDPITKAVSVTLTDQLGRTYRYAGFNGDTPSTDDGLAHPSYQFSALAQVGTAVFAGQILGYMGDTDPMPSDEHRGVGDEPVWPHLRLTIHDSDGTMVDAETLVQAAQRRQACHVAIGPWSIPADERLAGVSRDFRSDVEVSALDNGGFVLHADGTVTAYGRSALILAPEDCFWAPADPYGPGAAGSAAPAGWGQSFAIPASHWVTGAVTTDVFGPTALLRRP